ncbi:MAG TPA: GH25 family lysozyme, partial [Lachnospiraceae bacterium]|nr:GH25 family lysozyme [Lachnospiraceae bacterium]
IPSSVKKTTVKKDIAYQKVEVADEIKDESEVNSKKEDTKENGTLVESALTDTVTWVDSTKTVLDTTYIAIAKTSVTDPLAIAKRSSFLRTAAVTMQDLSLTIGEGGTSTGSVAVSVPTGFSAFQDGTISYTSTQTSVATVDSSGNLTARAVGTTIITFNAKGIKEGTVSDADPVIEDINGSCTVTVSATTTPVTQVTLNKATLSLVKDASETLSATVTPDTATNKNLSWTSSDATVASVDVATGKVIALKSGSATITASSVSNPDVKAQCTVTVTDPIETRTLTLDKDKLSAGVGTPVVIKATIGSSVSGNVSATITATSDKPTIADVIVGTAVNGVTPITINPKAAGTAVITVKADNQLTALCTVTVTDRTITLDKTTLSVLSTGKKVINAEVLSLGGEFKVETSDNKIATATITATKGTEKTTAKVEITGVAAGSATITVSHTEGGVTVKKTCTVTVVAKENKLVDSQKRQLYVLQSDGKYREATYADYYDASITNFYLRTEGTIKYTGWQTLEGKLFYYDASGKKITGEQVIQGAKYNFASDGSLVVGSGSFGIDVSKWNGTIDWNAVKNSGVSYVIIRCGYRGSSTGALIEDPKFASNIKGASAAGIKVGVYFFTQAVNRSEAVEEASMVIELVKKYTISYPVFLDVEASGGRADNIDKATRTDVIKAFCETIQNSGYTAGVYANKSWLTNKIDASQLGRYKIWLAQYASAPSYTGRYDMWQYKSTGKVTGISGNVDMNLSYLGY